MVLGFEMIFLVPIPWRTMTLSLVRIAISPVAVARTSAKASVASKCSRIAHASVESDYRC